MLLIASSCCQEVMEGTGALCHPHRPATESQTLSAQRNSLLVQKCPSQCLLLLVYPGDRELTTCWTTTLSKWPFLGEISPQVQSYSLTPGLCCALESPEPGSPRVVTGRADSLRQGATPPSLLQAPFCSPSHGQDVLMLVGVLMQSPVRPTP